MQSHKTSSLLKIRREVVALMVMYKAMISQICLSCSPVPSMSLRIIPIINSKSQFHSKSVQPLLPSQAPYPCLRARGLIRDKMYVTCKIMCGSGSNPWKAHSTSYHHLNGHSCRPPFFYFPRCLEWKAICTVNPNVSL